MEYIHFRRTISLETSGTGKCDDRHIKTMLKQKRFGAGVDAAFMEQIFNILKMRQHGQSRVYSDSTVYVTMPFSVYGAEVFRVLIPRIEYPGQIPRKAVAKGIRPIQPKKLYSVSGPKLANMIRPMPTMTRRILSLVPTFFLHCELLASNLGKKVSTSLGAIQI